MIRVAGLTLDGYIRYVQGEKYAELELRISRDRSMTDEEIASVKNAEQLEEFILEYGQEGDTIGTYNLYGWRRIVKDWDGSTIISWQTNRTTDIEQLRQDNEDLTQAILELAEIVGGEENG